MENTTPKSPHLVRGIGPVQATALNVTFVVGAGVFGTIPLMLDKMPGPWALCAWLAAGLLILLDGMVWSELGAAMPGSGGSYQYLLESFGRRKWGRPMAFLFIWQFLISGPLELASGLAFFAQFSRALAPEWDAFNKAHEFQWVLWTDPNAKDVKMLFNPASLAGVMLGVAVVALLWRKVATLGRVTVALWVGVLATLAWVLVEGWLRFDPAVAFDTSGRAAGWPQGGAAEFATTLGPAMALAMFSYLGYYNVCYVGDEVRDPGRTIPRSIFATVAIVVTLFVLVHLAILGVVPWQEVSKGESNLPALFMSRIHGPWAATLIAVMMLWCAMGSVFAGMLGYSRIPYGAARNGHFFSLFARVHPRHHFPHFSLLLIGSMTIALSFMDVGSIITALIVTRILEQFVAQIIGLVLLRRNRPDLYRPYKVWLYPLPCVLALAGWLYMYGTSGLFFIALGAITMASGVVAFLIWSHHTGGWPFDKRPDNPSHTG